MDSIASSLGVKKSEILDREADNMALRVLFAETSILKETKEVLEKEGVVLDILGMHPDKKVQRSNTIILVKNISFSTEASDLLELFRPFGAINRVCYSNPFFFLKTTNSISLVGITSSKNNCLIRI